MMWQAAFLVCVPTYLAGLWQGLREGQLSLSELTQHRRDSLTRVQDHCAARFDVLLEKKRRHSVYL